MTFRCYNLLLLGLVKKDLEYEHLFIVILFILMMTLETLVVLLRPGLHYGLGY